MYILPFLSVLFIFFSLCFQNSSTGRRYDWVQYKNGPTYGHSDRGCSYSARWVEGYRKYLFWRCMYCFCLCDEETPVSERYVSMEPAVSDVANNKLVDWKLFYQAKLSTSDCHDLGCWLDECTSCSLRVTWLITWICSQDCRWCTISKKRSSTPHPSTWSYVISWRCCR